MMTMSMINVHHHHHPLPLLKNKKPIPNPYRSSSSQNITFSFSFTLSTNNNNNYSLIITNQNQKSFSKQTHLHSFLPWNSSSSSSSSKPLKKNKFSSETVLLCVYLAIFLSLRLFFTTLPSDFPHRWSDLIVYSEEAETRVSDYPSHLLEAVVACEDRRFYRHWGIDPIGIARAVLSLSANGGGSTITQQLVKNTLLKNERTFSRKAVEMVLALLLERRISKRRILCTYLSKIYWGHGVFGIKSASLFYFGKHPSLLTVGESAMLVGIIPAPEFRSPFKHLSRGKTFQVRALRRMVEVGFLDMETALAIVDQPLHLRIDGPKHPNRQFYFSHKEGGRSSTVTDIWDWEQESCMWELREYMEKWGARVPKSTPLVFFSCKLIQNHFPRNRLVSTGSGGIMRNSPTVHKLPLFLQVCTIVHNLVLEGLPSSSCSLFKSKC